MNIRRAAALALRRLQHWLPLAVNPRAVRSKYEAEEDFWRRELERLVSWYRGEVPEHYRTPAPRHDQRVVRRDVRQAAILTWLELHQKPKYRIDLDLPPDVFRGARVLDLGAGPMPSGEVFEDCDLYCLDPLYPRYLEAGWPLHLYGPRTWFVHGHAEAMPLEEDSFDAVISANAIDHVDDFSATAREIRRVLRPGGRLRMHVHYHPPKRTEPLQVDDAKVESAFAWCPDLRKVATSREKTSAVAKPGESYALWSNFEA